MIAEKVSHYLAQHGVDYELRQHAYAEGCGNSARKAGLPLNATAKAVLTEDHEGRHVLAVIPADRRLSLYHMGSVLHRGFHLASEGQVAEIFRDCAQGAVPPIGDAYYLETVVDDALLNESEVYLEAGDHREFIHLRGDDFRYLMRNAPHGFLSANPEAGQTLYG